jgi:peptidyl-prolyl cis-trans isomerase A (cyclophilin A)
MYNWLNHNITVFTVLGFIALPIMFTACDTSKKGASNQGKGDNPVVLFSTNQGDIKVKLNRAEAPITVENFIGYVNEGFYNGVVFHRVIPNFMIQTGGFTPDMKQKTPKAPIKNEADNGLLNSRGTLSMARTSVVDSATSQFFINVNDNKFLDNGERDFGYAVFGEVIDGMDVVDKIAAVQTGTVGQFRDVPQEPIVINSAKVVE